MTDKRSLNRHLNKLYWKATSLIPRLLHLAVKEPSDFLLKNAQSANMEDKTEVRSGTILKKLLAETSNALLRKTTKAELKEKWKLFYRKADKGEIETDLNLYMPVPAPADAFWADPHAIEFNGRNYIFFEEWDYKKNKGHISSMEFKDDGSFSDAIKVLEQPFHLSYPFVFKSEGELYMIPETSANKTIELYRCTDIPYKWEFVMNLMENVHAVDATLFHHDNKWWLFTNMVETEGASSLDELFIFYSDDFRSREWKPHALNPVISDARTARPAGALFKIGEKIYRPSQCSDGLYGRSTNINEIITLTESGFLEKKIASLVPEQGGVHSFSKCGSITVIDRFFNK
jgi:hypothetical protein